MRRVLAISKWAITAAYLFLYAGFWFHRSTQPVVFGYSLGYLAFLLLMALPLGLPWLLRRIAKKTGWKKIWYALTPLFVLSIASYVVARIAYDYTRVYPFDPFLQVPAQRLDEQFPQQNPAGCFRILTMGGSTTRNHRLAPKDRYPSVVEQLLRDRYKHRRIEVINAGQDWWTTRHSLINYVSYAEQWNPDLVVVMHAVNDLEKSFTVDRLSIGDYDDLYTHYYGASANAAKAVTFEQFLGRRFLSNITRSWFSALRLETVDFPLEHYRSLKPFSMNLRRIVKFVRASGAKIMVVTQPFIFKADMSQHESESTSWTMHHYVSQHSWGREKRASHESIARAIRAFNTEAKRIAETHKTLFADGAAALPRDLEHFTDGIHYTPCGSRRLAKTVAQAIIDAALITP